MSSDPLIVWSDPPPRRGPGTTGQPSKYAPAINALQARPGVWACLQRSPDKEVVYAYSKGLRTAAKRRGVPLEVTARRSRDRDDYGVWAKYAPQDAS